MWTRKLPTIVAGSVLLSLCGCGTTGNYFGTPTSASASPSTTVSSGYGVVESIDVVPRENSGIGVGSIAGAVVGGVLGNQVGGGRGRTATTIAGAAGGALAGQEVEKRTRQSGQVYRITVRMEDGSRQTLAQEAQPGVRVGDRVRLANGTIVPAY